MTHKKFHRIRWVSMALIVVFILVKNILGGLSASEKSNGGNVLPIVVILVVGLLFVFLFGRVICGFFCPLGFLQDIIWKITEKLHLPKLRRDEKFMKIINIFNIAFLLFFICGIFCLIILGIFMPDIMTKVSIPPVVLIVMPIMMICINSFARRFFCNVCPIGSFIGIFEKLNIIKLEKDCKACTLCGACYEACPMRIKDIYTESEKTNVSSSKCLYCGECIKKCPEDNALAFKLCGKTIYKSSEDDFMDNQFADLTIKKKDK